MPIQDILVIDHAVPTNVQDNIRNIALGDKINWYRQTRATYADGQAPAFPVTPNAVDAQQFTHSVFDMSQGASPAFASLLPVVTAIPHTLKQLIRIKMNLSVYTQLDDPNAHGMPHVDFSERKEPLLTAIYYVNDATGDTIIFDQKMGDKGPLTIRQRISPRKGRLVVFNGDLLHAGNTPRTNAPRVNVNINAFVYEGARVS
ncbi:MAG: hypothetical protein GC151_07945 [Betaproteobacteria bacterium]|nr:hypothetical protein [Betaproteobacteria bacterium]